VEPITYLGRFLVVKILHQKRQKSLDNRNSSATMVGMNISTGVRSEPGLKYGIAHKRDNAVIADGLPPIDPGIVFPPDRMAANSRPCETIGVMLIPTMQSGICFKCPKPLLTENERKI